MDFKFAEFDLGHEIGIVFRNEYVFRFRLPDDFLPVHREALNHFLGLVAYTANHLPQTKKDELFRQYALKGKFPKQHGNHTTGRYVQILRMGEETQEKCQCPTRADSECCLNKTQKDVCGPYTVKKKPNI